MNNQRKRNMQIGFSQRIQLNWLERTAQLFLLKNNKEEIEKTLKDLLSDKLSVGGNAKRGNREKAITILMKIWVTVPNRLEDFREDGLKLIQELPKDEHLPVHWGMSMAVYPFFGIVAESIGRLSKLQNIVAASQIQRRIKEKLGERETVARAARRIIRSFVDWRVLKDTDKKGVYSVATKKRLDNKTLKGWLAEAALVSNGSHTLSLNGILERPAFFPFEADRLTSREIESNNRLSLFRHGLDGELVKLNH